MANVPGKQIFGTAQTVINTASSVTAGNFSATTTTFDNTTDAAVPYARYGKAVLYIHDWGAAPVAGTVVELWGLLKDVDGTDDDTQAPATTVNGGARFFGAWVMAADDNPTRRTITISLLGVEKCDFYYKNGTAQTATNTGTNSTVKITPFEIGVDV